MVLEYLPTFARTKSPSFVVKIVKYTSRQLFSSLPRVRLPRTLSRMAPSQISCFVLEQGSAKGKRLGKVCGDGSKRLVIFDLRALCWGPQLLWPKVAFQAKIAFWKGKPEREKHIKSYQQTCGLRKHFGRVSTEKYPNKWLCFFSTCLATVFFFSVWTIPQDQQNDALE